MPDGPGVRRVRRRALRLPVGRQGVAGVARGGRHARHPRRRRGAPRRVVPRRARPAGRPRRHVGQRQVDHRLAGPPPLRRRQRRRARRRRRRAGPDVRLVRARRSAWSPRTATCSTTRSARTCASPGPRPPTTSCGTRSRKARLGRPRRVAARRARHRGRRAGLPVLRRRAPAPHHRPPAAGPAAGRDPRRGHVEPRLHLGGRRAGGADRRPRRPHGHRDRPPPVDDPRRRRDPRRRGRPHRRARHPRRAAGRRRPLRRALPHPVRHPPQRPRPPRPAEVA